MSLQQGKRRNNAMSVINSVHVTTFFQSCLEHHQKKVSFSCNLAGEVQTSNFRWNVGAPTLAPQAPFPAWVIPTYGVRTNMAQPSLVSQAAPAGEHHHPKDGVWKKTWYKNHGQLVTVGFLKHQQYLLAKFQNCMNVTEISMCGMSPMTFPPTNEENLINS